jgi:hypothetical protein
MNLKKDSLTINSYLTLGEIIHLNVKPVTQD